MSKWKITKRYFMEKENLEFSLSTTHFGATMDSKHKKMVFWNQLLINTPIKFTFIIKWENRFFKTHSMGITVVFLHMVKQVLVNLIRWLDMEKTKVLSPKFHLKFSIWLSEKHQKKNGSKLTFLCWKFIMKKFKIYWFL